MCERSETFYQFKYWPKSELVRDPGQGVAIEHENGFEKVQWSPWRLIVRPTDRKGDWHEYIPFSKSEPPYKYDKGVYQVAISDEEGDLFPHPIVVYVGRARGDSADAKYSLRKRLQQYIRGQDRIAKSLKIFLDIGCSVYIRWSCHPFELVDRVEEALLAEYDYPLAKTHNPPVRHMEDILMNVEDTDNEEALSTGESGDISVTANIRKSFRNMSFRLQSRGAEPKRRLVKCYDYILEQIGASPSIETAVDDTVESHTAEDGVVEKSGNINVQTEENAPGEEEAGDAAVLHIVKQFLRLSKQQQQRCRQYLDAFLEDDAEEDAP